MRITQILNGTAHWIFEAEEFPAWPPGPDGEEMVFVDITDMPEVAEGWIYNPKKGTFTAPKAPEPIPEPELVDPEPTNAELKELQLIQMGAIADLVEVLLEGM